MKTVPIHRLRNSESPRIRGENDEHVAMLAQTPEELPPILVHRQTMRVLDGMHRLRAAKLRGAQSIEVVFYDGDEKDAFVVAVQANVQHGMPLSFADRAAAATRILTTHPHWSDRTISSVTGLAPKTVGVIRKRSSVSDTQSNVRIGLDGRARPVTTAARRRLAGEILKENPSASVRHVAKAAELAPSTVLDVRNRLRNGQDLVPASQRGATTRPAPIPAQRSSSRDRAPAAVDLEKELFRLKADPALRYSKNGRLLLRALGNADPTRLPNWPDMVRSVPDHCLPTFVLLAKEMARTWMDIATLFEQRADT